MKFLKGKKTYLIATATLVYAVMGLALGHLDGAAAGQLITTALISMGLRNAIE